jgi:SAM-dependent methyltransferase
MSTEPLDQFLEEIFCLKYELRLLSGQVMGLGLERWIEGFTPPQVEVEHLQRYKFASQFAKNQKILDIACGTGRGSRLLAEGGLASTVVGYDIDEEAVKYAMIRNRHPRVTFTPGDGLTSSIGENYDLVVCFETVEHLRLPQRFLRKVAGALKPNGTLLISTPVATKEFDSMPRNPHHRQEWGCQAFQELLRESFEIRKMFIQYHGVKIDPIWRRILSRVVGGSRWPSTARDSVKPSWTQVDPLSFVKASLAKYWAGYQILECSPLPRLGPSAV